MLVNVKVTGGLKKNNTQDNWQHTLSCKKRCALLLSSVNSEKNKSSDGRDNAESISGNLTRRIIHRTCHKRWIPAAALLPEPLDPTCQTAAVWRSSSWGVLRSHFEFDEVFEWLLPWCIHEGGSLYSFYSCFFLIFSRCHYMLRLHHYERETSWIKHWHRREEDKIACSLL